MDRLDATHLVSVKPRSIDPCTTRTVRLGHTLEGRAVVVLALKKEKKEKKNVQTINRFNHFHVQR
jgi:hypothetical protein